jgi:hypothetical protein
MYWLEQYVKDTYKIEELEIGHLYKISDIMIETPNGFKPTIGFIKKKGNQAFVEFESGIKHECLSNHMYIAENGKAHFVYNMVPGDKIRTRNGIDIVKAVTITENEMFAYDLSVDSNDQIFVTADGIQSHNTGKTQTVEKVLHNHGLSDGNGYFKNTGTASALGIYSLLYKHRDGILLFDDSDGALADQDGRNLIKAATDTKKHRKIAWNKKSAGMYDPEHEDAEEYAEDADKLPRHFEFTGRIIFISNLPLSKLDPDGALRTRAFVINIDPTDEELYEHMEKILHEIKLEDGLSLSNEERENVLTVVKKSKRKGDVSLRKLVRALNLAASGAPNWERLVSLYA